MIQTFISRRHTDDLILLFAGWGMDTHPFACLSHIGCDCCVCYDYTDLNFDTTPFLDYKNIEVYAWSFGVWAAATVLPDKGLPIRHATAINGTECGIDIEKGIPPEIFRATLEHLNEASLKKFYRRMCCEHLDDFKEAFPERDMNSLYDELRAIGENITLHPRPRFRWDKAIIGTRDLIFPARNQVNAWEGTTVFQELDEPHFFHFRPVVLENRLDKATIKNSFGNAASTYEREGLIQSRIARQLNDKIPSRLNKCIDNILEIGCGTGKTDPLSHRQVPRCPVHDKRPVARNEKLHNRIAVQPVEFQGRRCRKNRVRRNIPFDYLRFDDSMVHRFGRILETHIRQFVRYGHDRCQHIRSRQSARNTIFNDRRNALLGVCRVKTIVRKTLSGRTFRTRGIHPSFRHSHRVTPASQKHRRDRDFGTLPAKRIRLYKAI